MSWSCLQVVPSSAQEGPFMFPSVHEMFWVSACNLAAECFGIVFIWGMVWSEKKQWVLTDRQTGISKHGYFWSWEGLFTILMPFMMMLSTSRNSLEKSLMPLMRLSESNTSVRQLFLMIIIIIIIIIIMVMVMMKLMMTLMMSERSNSVRLMYRAAVSRLLLLVNHPPGAARWK